MIERRAEERRSQEGSSQNTSIFTFLGGNNSTQFVLEGRSVWPFLGVMPDLLYVDSVGHNSVLNGVFEPLAIL